MNTETFTKKRIIALIVAIVLACTALFALSGCQSKEQQAEEALKSDLNDYKNGSEEIFANQDAQDLSQIGLDPKELQAAMTEDFTFEIKGSKANADTNTVDVEVSIHSRQVANAIKTCLPDMLSYALSASLTGMSEQDIQQHLAEMILDQLKKEEAVDTTIAVPMSEDSGAWSITGDGEQALAGAIVGDLGSIQSVLPDDTSGSSQVAA